MKQVQREMIGMRSPKEKAKTVHPEEETRILSRVLTPGVLDETILRYGWPLREFSMLRQDLQ